MENSKNNALEMCKEMWREKKELKTIDFVKILEKSFFAINDNHFSLVLNTKPLSESFNLCKQNYVHFSNIYVKKIEDKYQVVYGGGATVSKGDIFTDSPIYLFRYPALGEDVYRVCCISSEKVLNEKVFFFNGKPKKCLMSHDFSNSSDPDKIEINEIFGKSFSYVFCSSFYFYEYDNEKPNENELLVIEKFKNAIKTAFKKETVILDLRENQGGYTGIVLTALNEVIDDFSGTLYILINKYTASASEVVSYKLKNYPNIKALTIGEKTKGAITTGSPIPFCLKYSGIIANIPVFPIEETAGIFKEGMGIMPDYWAFSGDVVDTLYSLTGNEEIREKLSIID